MHDHVFERNIADRNRKEVDTVVTAAESRFRDEILTAVDNMVIPRTEMSVKSITESLGHGPNSVVQNPNQNVFSGIMENILRMGASSRVDLKIDPDRNDDTRNVEKFEDGHFPALNFICVRQLHAHHSRIN